MPDRVASSSEGRSPGQVDSRIVRQIVEATPATSVKPMEFFVAWSGVMCLAYEGFTRPLLDIKRDIGNAVPGLKPENPGSAWPKTTLGALRDDKALTWAEVVALRGVCHDMNKAVAAAEALQVDDLSLVVFACRSLERRLAAVSMPLSGPPRVGDHEIPADHAQAVRATMRQFEDQELRRYWPSLLRTENRESHYRLDHVEATLVYDLPSDPPDYFEHLIAAVEQALPGAYYWFAPESRHMTIRALTT